MTKLIKQVFEQDNVKLRFKEMLGGEQKMNMFISSVLQAINGNKSLMNAEPNSVLNAAATAASLDLPINQNLGFSWIVPYRGNAQFQMGWKGYVQLALRTGQYARINVTEVYENQFESFDRLTEELKGEFDIDGEGEVVGYAAYFKLINGMEKTVYWTKDSVIKHAKKYSQAYGKGKMSPWNDADTFDAMAKKTVLKNMIAKWGIMSVEMQTGILSDQSVQRSEGKYDYDDNTIDIEYDNQIEEEKRFLKFVEDAETLDDLDILQDSLETKSDEVLEIFEAKRKELGKLKKTNK